MKCQHEEIFFNLEIIRWVAGSMDARLTDMRLNRPVRVNAKVSCPDCGFDSVYNAYGSEWVKVKGYGADSGSLWPIWLKKRMRVLAATSPIITEALRACGVLARDEEVAAL
jgi:hypothetical protein